MRDRHLGCGYHHLFAHTLPFQGLLEPLPGLIGVAGGPDEPAESQSAQLQESGPKGVTFLTLAKSPCWLHWQRRAQTVSGFSRPWRTSLVINADIEPPLTAMCTSCFISTAGWWSLLDSMRAGKVRNLLDAGEAAGLAS